jgi:hypothetical protein
MQMPAVALDLAGTDLHERSTLCTEFVQASEGQAICPLSTALGMGHARPGAGAYKQ